MGDTCKAQSSVAAGPRETGHYSRNRDVKPRRTLALGRLTGDLPDGDSSWAVVEGSLACQVGWFLVACLHSKGTASNAERPAAHSVSATPQSGNIPM